MGFIPDLGVSEKKKSSDQATKTKASSQTEEPQSKDKSAKSEEKKTEKKIVSYNLDVNLISKVKSVANSKDMYYSSLVTVALKRWLAEEA